MPLLCDVKNELGSSGELTFELFGCYVEGMRWIQAQTEGPYIQIFGAVTIDKPVIELLSGHIPLYYHHCDMTSRRDLASLLWSFKETFMTLRAFHRDVQNREIDADQSGPYSTYLSTIVEDETDLNGTEVIVKFSPEKYGLEAHKEAAKLGFAPTLLGRTLLPGQWNMVIMAKLDDDFKCFDDLDDLDDQERQAIMSNIRDSVNKLHASNFVHGDLRKANVEVRKQPGP
ncbi:hypothetical protein CPB83DRAFT_912930 [Crepidotus variabilis]|uniref:Uncharacterized protein n=1 Tax=Crepidotus variabilis TaxID=179855 RepID=A0A9P6EVL3_9AGAR|nr:hypothetical protein CPB83DRAFT_912930 [Crepidotus variabilis]